MEVVATINRLSSPGQYLTKMYVLEEIDMSATEHVDIDKRIYTKQLKSYDFEALFGKERIHEYNFISERYDYLGFVWMKHPLYPLYERMSDINFSIWDTFRFTEEEYKLLKHYCLGFSYDRFINSPDVFYQVIDEIYRNIFTTYHIKNVPVKTEDKSVIYAYRIGKKQCLNMNEQFCDFIKYEKLSRFAFDNQTLEYIKNKCAENPDEFQHNIIDKFEEGKDVVIFNADFIKNVKYWE